MPSSPGGLPRYAGVVLAGGRSARMGTPKAALEWHGSTLLRRTVAILARATGGPVVVVRAKGQELPGLPDGVQVVDDPREDLGPVQGLAAGLGALAGLAEVAFVSATDMPFLHPAFVRRVLRAVGAGTAVGEGADVGEGAEVGLPVARGYPQPLAAAYRTALAPLAESLVRDGLLRPAFLFRRCQVSRLDEAALLGDPVLAALDPGLDSLANVNQPDDYRQARARTAPEITIQWASGPESLRAATVHAATVHAATVRPATVHAATLAEAAAAAGARLGNVTAALNGDQLVEDAQTPLVAGDTVSFRPSAP
jgi:molybdopterin-guanine dinucleotide biosynthesis protein A